MVKGQENMTQRERLKELGLFSLAKRIRGSITAVDIYLTALQKRQSQTPLNGARQHDKEQWTQAGAWHVQVRHSGNCVLQGRCSTGTGAWRGYENFVLSSFKTLLKPWLNSFLAGNSPTSYGRLEKPPELPPSHHFCFLFQLITLTTLQGVLPQKCNLLFVFSHALN